MYENKKDIFENVKSLIPNVDFYILDKVYEELDKVYKTKPIKNELIKRYLKKLEVIDKFKIIKVDQKIIDLSPKYLKVDNLLVYFSDKYLVYTNDRKLKEKLKLNNKKVLTLKRDGVVLN
jgi:rRNA-processing protein FCF1